MRPCAATGHAPRRLGSQIATYLSSIQSVSLLGPDTSTDRLHSVRTSHRRKELVLRARSVAPRVNVMTLVLMTPQDPYVGTARLRSRRRLPGVG